MRSEAADWGRAMGLAALAGTRTLVTPALLSRTSGQRAPLRAAATLLAVVELVGDKLPRTLNRTSPLLLAMRLATGAGVARAMLRRRGRTAGVGAALAGAACAGLSTFLGLRIRRALTRRLGGGQRANVLAGAIEDAALIAIGTRLVCA
jgi:uncharacterized membrane protein